MRTFFSIFRGFVFLCIAAAMTAAIAAADLRLAAGDGTVDVFDADGRLLQSLPFDGETPDEDNRDFFAIAEDMDFDGRPDVRILHSRGMVNLYYDCWLWRPEAKIFAKREDMRELSNPVFDQETRTVHVYERGSATSHVEGDLGWEKGGLVWLGQTVVDEADDGENIVVRRYLRDYTGKLRLVAEETRRPADTDEGVYSDMDDAYYRPELPGLNLILDLPADTLDVAVLPNGEWWRRQAMPDRSFLYESRRLPAAEYGADSIRRAVTAEWPLARELAIAPFPELGEKTTYPAYKAEFLYWNNEDTRQFVAAMVFADEWSFLFVVETSVNTRLSETEFETAHEDNVRLKQDMERLLLGIEAADPADGDFLPFFGLPVYLAGVDSPLRISVMEALIRIRKIVGPENSPWLGEGNIAYRYDGPGTAGGRPALTFSFGADSWEKFTAERHFAVDETGTVFEMDVVNGGDYWEWDERGIHWWGEFRNGDVVLDIGNFREGPSGMYFNFRFTVGEKEVASGTAPARNREARYGALVFSLAENDESVTVRIDREAGDAAERDGLVRLEGAYSRE